MAEGGETRVHEELKMLQLLKKPTSGFYEQLGKHDLEKTRFCKSAVLNSRPRAPPLCIFRMLLLSLQMFVLLERKCPAKWTSQDIPP